MIVIGTAAPVDELKEWYTSDWITVVYKKKKKTDFRRDSGHHQKGY